MSTTPSAAFMPAIYQEGHPMRPILSIKDAWPNHRHESWRRWVKANKGYTHRDRRAR